MPVSLKAGQSTPPCPELSPILSANVATEIVLEFGLHGAQLRYPLSVWYCAWSADDVPLSNRAVSHLVGPFQHRAWYGPVVVLKYSGVRRRHFMDVYEGDLATMSAYFRTRLVY